MDRDQLLQELTACSEIPESLQPKLEALVAGLSGLESAVIAYSGGVDSSFLAYIASKILADKMVAVMLLSPLENPAQVEIAARFARQHLFDHVIIPYDLLQNPDVRKNAADRCYHCKLDILRQLWAYARKQDYQVVLEGQNIDDLSDYRPGRRAVMETGTLSPLAQAGLHKAEIRQLAKAFNLSVWDQPSAPCLATRIPYGTLITQENLNQVLRAEDFLHQRGIRLARVRHHAETARIEVHPDDMQAVLEFREEIVQAFRQIGFRYVALDLQGYRLGSMNEGMAR